MATIIEQERPLSPDAVQELVSPLHVEPTPRTQPLFTSEFFLRMMIAVCCVFGGAFAMYVLYPAISTLLGSSTDTWSQGF